MSDGSRELVFVYGSLRRGASNAFRMKGASWEGMRIVRGALYQISWYPGIVLNPEGGPVVGELWRVTSGQLRELDEFEGVPEGETEGDEYRRVRVKVEGLPEPGKFAEWESSFDPHAPQEAWIWEWKGNPLGGQLIPTGDWLDLESPPQKPVFTSIGCMGVLGFTIGTQVLVGTLLSQFPSLKIPDTTGTWISLASMALAVTVGAYCLHMATRRREPGYAFQLLTGLAVLFFLFLVVTGALLRILTLFND